EANVDLTLRVRTTFPQRVRATMLVAERPWCHGRGSPSLRPLHHSEAKPLATTPAGDMRWLWIDRFLEFNSGKSARAVKNLSLAEAYFADHFPGYPVFPAALLLEGLAQTGGILAGEARDFREKVVLAKITTARFHREALAGEQLIYDVEIVTLRDEGASVVG